MWHRVPHHCDQCPTTSVPISAIAAIQIVDTVARTNGRAPTFLNTDTCTPVPSANIAAVSNAGCTILAEVSDSVGSTPDDRTTTQTMNAATNGGTSGGRPPAQQTLPTDGRPRQQLAVVGVQVGVHLIG